VPATSGGDPSFCGATVQKSHACRPASKVPRKQGGNGLKTAHSLGGRPFGADEGRLGNEKFGAITCAKKLPPAGFLNLASVRPATIDWACKRWQRRFQSFPVPRTAAVKRLVRGDRDSSLSRFRSTLILFYWAMCNNHQPQVQELEIVCN